MASHIKTINVSEYLTSHNYGIEPDDPAHSMYVEGLAMLTALVDDARRIRDVRVNVNVDRGNDDFCDYEIPIAPESFCEEGLIYDSSIARSRARTPVVSDLPAIELTADKLRMHQHWTRFGVRTPDTQENGNWPRSRLPAVIKLRDGCGSMNMRKVETTSEWLSIAYQNNTIVQDFIPGRAASVAFLAGNCDLVPLLPTWQTLSDDCRFHYRGGQIPIPHHLAARAIRLGLQAVKEIGGLKGYIGVDLILGKAADGSQDYAIEINPRLTTSYVGLRALADFNLAQAMIDVVEGKPVDYIMWKPGRVQFWPDGRVEYDPTPGAVWD